METTQYGSVIDWEKIEEPPKYILFPEIVGNRYITAEELAELQGVPLDNCIVFDFVQEFPKYLDYIRACPDEYPERWRGQERVFASQFEDELKRKYRPSIDGNNL